MLFAVILCFVFCYFLYETYYFRSNDFLALKASVMSYIRDCNELNEHIEELKTAYVGPNHQNYGHIEYKDNSKFHYKRPELSRKTQSQFVYDCSLSVFKNASEQPMKYLCKYFNINADEENLCFFERVLNDFAAAEQGKALLITKRDVLVDSISSNVPFIIRKLRKQKLIKKLGFEKIDLSCLYFPKYTFRYVSAGGNSAMSCDIVLDIVNLELLVNYLAGLVKFRKSVAGQRALMTPALREKIKQRDNYTCQKCGISVAQEPHLLLEIDHKTSLANGGLTTEENLRTLCWKCNRKKGAKNED